MVARQAHNLEAAGSSPAPAIGFGVRRGRRLAREGGRKEGPGRPARWIPAPTASDPRPPGRSLACVALSDSEWKTAGEALCRRELKKERRAGVTHYVTGQHGCFVEDGIAYVTFVDQLGHALSVPFHRPEREWVQVGVYFRAGQYRADPPRQLPDDFRPSERMLAALEGAK